MRVLVHLSDTHFGRVDYAIVERLKEKIEEINPHLIIVSGDLTQRARSHQFIEARRFLESLPQPQIVVPGNHDVPLYNIFARFFTPLEKYKKYISKNLQPFYKDEEIAVVGVNTARSLTIKDGGINQRQVAQIRRKICDLNDKMLKIVVTHHPFGLPDGFDEGDIARDAARAIPQIADCGADVFLSGHLHVSRITHTAERYKILSGRSALFIQAGTATSTRGRGEANSFNVIEFEHPHLIVKRLRCLEAKKGFILAESQKFLQTENGWRQSEY